MNATPRRVVPRRAPVAASAVAVAVLVICAGVWWLLHPDRLDHASSSTSLDVAVGEGAVLGMFAYPDTGSVGLRDATARVAENTAAAEVTVAYCRPPNGSVYGAARGDLREACGRLPRLDGRRLGTPTPRNGLGYLVVHVLPRRPGVVRIDGIDVSYTAGLRRGTEHAGVDATVRAR